MARRFHTKDGKKVQVGDRVWSQNHWPWTIVGVEDRGGMTWVLMEHTEVEYDTLSMAAQDFGDYIYKSHPPKKDCRRAGCQDRPWGVQSSLPRPPPPERTPHPCGAHVVAAPTASGGMLSAGQPLFQPGPVVALCQFRRPLQQRRSQDSRPLRHRPAELLSRSRAKPPLVTRRGRHMLLDREKRKPVNTLRKGVNGCSARLLISVWRRIADGHAVKREKQMRQRNPLPLRRQVQSAHHQTRPPAETLRPNFG